MPVKTVLVVANRKKPNVEKVSDAVEKELRKRNIDFYFSTPAYFKLNNNELLTDFDDQYQHFNYDLIIAIGGDGTFLYTARTFADFDIPIIGINAGRVGFLMEVSPDDLSEALEKVLNKDLELKKRMLLKAEIYRQGKRAYRSYFLNDAVVSKGALSRMVEISILIDDESLSQYRADGLIVSTPTGSTAYNLSAGGPILSHDMEAMVITPICPHTIGLRPIVLNSTKVLKVKLIGGEADTTLTIDGQENFYLKPNDVVLVKKSKKSVRIFDYGERKFFSVLREKLGWLL